MQTPKGMEEGVEVVRGHWLSCPTKHAKEENALRMSQEWERRYGPQRVVNDPSHIRHVVKQAA